MIRKLSLSVVTVSLFASLACAEDIKVNFDDGKGVDISGQLAGMEVPPPTPAGGQEKGPILDWFINLVTPKPKPQPPKPVPAKPEWTIMVFSNAKNDLERFLLSDINEMEMIGSTAKVNIVVQVGRMEGYDSGDGDWKGVRRYLVTKDTDSLKMGSKPLEDLGMIDMGDYKSLSAFGKWAKLKFPAKKYMMIVSNHGSGWEKSGGSPLNKGISYDEQSGNHIDTPQLGQALKEMGKVDVFGTDACLMQMAEVDYEIKDAATYIVGSEETEPGDGYTYNDFLGPVAANPAMPPLELAKLAVDAYSDHYQKRSEGSTQSVVKAASVAKLLPLTNAFAAAVMASGDKALARKARDGSVKYAIPENKDLYDFVRQVAAGTKSAEVRSTGQALMAFITSELVAHNRTNNSPGGFWSEPVDYSPSKGIAAYFPASSLGAGYADLQWSKVSQWDEFSSWMLQP